MVTTKHEMPEIMYRSSRFCRVLGNPTAYLILRALQNGRLTVKELSEKLGISESAASFTLRNLRQIEVVRYETNGQNKLYWLKSESLVPIVDAIEEWIEETRRQQA